MAIQSESLEKISNKDTDNTLSANSDIKYPSQKAVKYYIDTLIGNANALVYKGTIDCSGNPNYPAADAGWNYVVSVSGKIGGASGISVDVGDMLLCKVDSSAAGDQATVGANWNIIEKNIVGAVSGPDSSVDNNIAVFNSTTGKIIKDSGKIISTDGTLVNNSDNNIPTEKAVKTYADTKIQGDGSVGIENNILNGDFESFSLGTTLAPDNWTLSGTNATVAKELSIVKIGTSSVKLTRSGNTVVLYQNIHLPKGINYWKNRKITLSAFVYSTVANRARLAIDDGPTASVSTYHTGDSTWQLLKITHTVDASATQIQCSCQLLNGDTSVYFDGVVLIEGESCFAFSDRLVPPTGNQGDILYHTGTLWTKLSTGIKQQTLKLTYDLYTKLLIHFDNADAVTLYRAETGQTLTFNGNAQLDNSQHKFGDTSLLLDGNDSVTIPDSDDWYFGTGDFTIECYVRFTTLPSVGSGAYFLHQTTDSTNGWRFYLYNDGGTHTLVFRSATGGVNNINFYQALSGNLSTNTWYHIAITKSGTNVRGFIDGTQIGSTVTATGESPQFAAVVTIGDYVDGHMDEIRISKDIARWTSNFTPHALNYENYDLIPTWAKEEWIDYSAFSTIVGWSSFTTKKIYYKQVGNMLYVAFDLTGTSNNKSVTFTLPFLKTATNPLLCAVTTIAEDNSVYLTSPGRINISNSYIVACYSDLFTGAWTNSGEKRVMGNFWAEIA